MFPRLQRFDVEFDIRDAFLPKFPPAIFLPSRPELGDVSRGEVVSINNFHRLFKDTITPVQLDGLRQLEARDARLPRQWPHHRPVPPEPGQPTPSPPAQARHGEPARALQPTDPRQ